MARKQKKSSAQRQRQRQQKQQRRSVRKERQDPSRTFAAPSALAAPNITALPELAPFLNRSAGGDNMIALFELAIDSADLLEEPEFDQPLIEPIEAVGTLIKTAEEMGLGPDVLQEATTERDEEAKEELISKLCQQLVTPALRRQLIQGLNHLRTRLRKPAEQSLRQQVAAVQFILETDETGELVPLLGFVRSLIFRGVDAGFTLMGAVAEMEEVEEQAGPLSPEELQERLAQSGWGANLEQALEQSPELRHYLDNQIDQMMEEGVKATFSGELALNLYTPDEVAVALQMARTAIEVQADGIKGVDAIKVIMSDLIPQYTDYIVQLFSPERLDQLRTDLAALAAHPTYVGTKWAPFLNMKQGDFAEEDAIDNEQRFLVAALLGQVLPILKAEDEQEE